jgi:hypothetical protein
MSSCVNCHSSASLLYSKGKWSFNLFPTSWGAVLCTFSWCSSYFDVKSKAIRHEFSVSLKIKRAIKVVISHTFWALCSNLSFEWWGKLWEFFSWSFYCKSKISFSISAYLYSCFTRASVSSLSRIRCYSSCRLSLSCMRFTISGLLIS